MKILSLIADIVLIILYLATTSVGVILVTTRPGEFNSLPAGITCLGSGIIGFVNVFWAKYRGNNGKN